MVAAAIERAAELSSVIREGQCSARIESADHPCNEPAVVKRGFRCVNGCFGEGTFEYACTDHRVGLEEYDRCGVIYCNACRQPSVEMFPVQEIR